MRCVRCNKTLTPYEEVHKNAHGDFADTCFSCLYGDVPGEDDSLDDLFWDSDYDQADLFMDR